MNAVVGSEGAPHAHRCGDLAERIERFLDGELDEAQTAQLREHMASCYPCAEELELRDQIRALVRQGCEQPAPPDLVARIRARLVDVTDGEPTRG